MVFCLWLMVSTLGSCGVWFLCVGGLGMSWGFSVCPDVGE